MGVVTERRMASSSSLNPDAPMFVPIAYRAVEDFSNQWWNLVHSSPCFRDYWLRECFHDPQSEQDFYDLDLSTLGSIFDDDVDNIVEKEEEKTDLRGDLVKIGSGKWQKGRVLADAPRYAMKVPKIVNLKVVSPRMIQQPR